MPTVEQKEKAQQRNLLNDLYMQSKWGFKPKLKEFLAAYEELVTEKEKDQLIPEIQIFHEEMENITTKAQNDNNALATYVKKAIAKARTEASKRPVSI